MDSPTGEKKQRGRQAGSRNKATQFKLEKAQKAIQAGITPLEVLLEAMREAWSRDPRDTEKAVSYASMAAPYVHPKLGSVVNETKQLTVRVIDETQLLDDDHPEVEIG